MNHINRTLSAFVLFFMLLGIKDGYLALWKSNDPMPVKVFPVPAASLPGADQILLRRGIRADDPLTLQTLLEDYL